MSFSLDEWDSEVLGVRAAKMVLPPEGSYFERQMALSSAFDEMLAAGVEYAVCKVPSEDTVALHLLQSWGFRVLSCQLTMILRLDNRNSVSSRCQTREAALDDLPHLEQLARESFRHDRFHRDPILQSEIADESRVSWLRNSFRDPESVVFAASRNGFVCVKSTGSIELLCVRKELRGLGIGAALVEASLQWLSGRAEQARVVVHCSNIPALCTYLKAGFKPAETFFVLRGRF